MLFFNYQYFLLSNGLKNVYSSIVPSTMYNVHVQGRLLLAQTVFICLNNNHYEVVTPEPERKKPTLPNIRTLYKNITFAALRDSSLMRVRRPCGS